MAMSEPVTVDIPPELLRIGELLHTQDNRVTAHPIFLVQQRRRIYGVDTDYVDAIAWLDDEGDEVDPDLAATLEHAYQNGGDAADEFTREYTRTGYVDNWEYVAPFFTEAAADRYIASNSHNLCDPRTYADSAYRNPEWQVIRDFLRSLPRPVGGPASGPECTPEATERPPEGD